MARRTVNYKQGDSRWGSLSYAAKGETSTIKTAGCGITASASILATLVDSKITPKTTRDWSLKQGYKAYHAGTYHSYFKPQFAKYGLVCKQLTSNSVYHKPNDAIHDTVKKELEKGNYIIACMGAGLWTSAGHYIVVYNYKDGKVYIDDPASSREERACNTWTKFKNEVKHYWVVEVPEKEKVTITEEKSSVKSIRSKKEVVTDLQNSLNIDYKTKLKKDGSCGELTLGAVKKYNIKSTSKSNTVKWIQRVCNELGYTDGNGKKLSVDGDYGKNTLTAVVKLQKALGLKGDGIVGTDTVVAILKKYK